VRASDVSRRAFGSSLDHHVEMVKHWKTARK